MFINAIKGVIIAAFILITAPNAEAQQIHFVYLQTENEQPFYVKLDNKLISSSVEGYLILPKMRDGIYKLSLGFPKNQFPEQNFQIDVTGKDAGFLVKNFDEKGWGLFNMETYEVIMDGGNKSTDTVVKNLSADPFSKMLANVIKDSSILQKDVPERAALLAKKDTAVETIAADTNAKVVSQLPQPEMLSPAKKIKSTANTGGREMVYVDSSSGGSDTIKVFVPADQPVVIDHSNDTLRNIAKSQRSADPGLKDSSLVLDAAPAWQNSSPSATKQQATLAPDSIASSQPLTTAHDVSPVRADTAGGNSVSHVVASQADVKQPAVVTQDSTQANRAALPRQDLTPANLDTMAVKTADNGMTKITEGSPAQKRAEDSVKTRDIKTTESTTSDPGVTPQVIKSSIINSDCQAFAENDDFLKLRKRMASENSDDDMIKAAKKAFRLKCFSTEQIKNLSFLFLTNEGKYRFFDEAYAFASDSDQFYTLQSQLTDSYYVNRFKAMIHK